MQENILRFLFGTNNIDTTNMIMLIAIHAQNESEWYVFPNVFLIKTNDINKNAVSIYFPVRNAIKIIAEKTRA